MLSTARIRLVCVYLFLLACVAVPVVGVLTIDSEPPTARPDVGTSVGEVAGTTAVELAELVR